MNTDISMTPAEKEQLANRVVALLRADNLQQQLKDLRDQVDSGNEGADGMNSVVLAIASAVAQHYKL